MDNSKVISGIDDTIEYRCNICDHKSFTKSFPGLIQCTNCDFITANVTLTPEDIHRLYGASYFSGDEYADYLGDKKIIQKNLSNWLAIIRKYVDSGNLIEIGSAYGFFLEIASEHFHSQGYEISQSAARYSRDVTNVTTSNLDFLDEKEIASGSVDVAAMWDVIEHLSDPAAVLEKLRTVLKHNGHIFITTGDIDSKLAKAQGKTWR
ncbi:MAG: methyltransferase domain-containing protein, partial [Chloroflexota bacterium]|nr:methyltransferase domain-containing protein [Chloroflexota bacterium]